MNIQTRGLASSLLDAGKPPVREFSASVVLQVALVLTLAWMPAFFPERLQAHKPVHVVMLATPKPFVAPPRPAARPEQPRPAPRQQAEPKMELDAAPVEAARPERRIQPVRFSSPVVTSRHRPRVNVPDAPVVDAPAARTESELLSGSSAAATLRRPREEVQTGGFGDPHGVPASAARGDRPANINALGQWDLPSGPGYGSGTGGARGERGTVASAGFGRGVAVGNPPRSSGGGEVREGSFGAVETGSSQPRQRQAEPREAPLEPVEILSKPRPAYTAEARAKRREGEVLLEVQFTAAGAVRVLRVVRGLGDGLDESAVAAARQMKFRPARRAGAPVDSVANVIITFQLAD
jgi:TonB family protein